MIFNRFGVPFLASFWPPKSIPGALGREQVDPWFWTTVQWKSSFFTLERARGHPKSLPETLSGIYVFSKDFQPKKYIKITPKRTQNCKKNALKNNSKNITKNDTEITSKWTPKWSLGRGPGTPKITPGDPWEASRASWGCPGCPRGAPGVVWATAGAPRIPKWSQKALK